MIRTTLTPQVHAFLERDRVPTLNIQGILRNEPGWELLVDDEACPQGVLVKGPWFWYVHTEDEGFLALLFAELDREAGFYRFSGVWRPLAERIKARYPLVWDAPCRIHVLQPGLHQAGLVRHPVRSVALEDAELIDEHYAYRHARSLENIRACIRNRNSSAVYVAGRPVCWLLVHEDDSLGIMYTLEEHRRQGYAVDVTVDLVGKQLAAGRTPFLQIRTDNGMSPGLAQKCGFVPQGGCDWFGIVSGTPPELVEGGRAFLQRLGAPPAGEACCYRFLHTPSQEPLETELLGEAEWLASAARSFDRELLAGSLAAQAGSWRLLGLRRDGRVQATAALLVDDDDGCELAWLSHPEPAFLDALLRQAKALGMSIVFTHTNPERLPLFESLGFRSLGQGPG